METCTNIELGVAHADKTMSNTTSSNQNQETSSNNIGPNMSGQRATTDFDSDNSATDNKPNLNNMSKNANVNRGNGSSKMEAKSTGQVQTLTNLQAQSSLSQLLEYGLTDSEDSDSDSHDTATDSEVTTGNDNESSSTNLNNKIQSTEFRDNSSDSSSSDSEYESDSSSSCSDIGACAVTPVSEKKTSKKKMNPLRTRGEIGIEDLPPIEELKISVPEQECIQMGTVSSIIDQLVIIQSLPGQPAYDIDTVFFLNAGKQPLGKVFDVLGPVTEPYYAVRFNSYEQAIETGAKPGIPVYCAPSRHASYVFVSELMKIKGSDASWEHNNEPPVMFLDFSDDEDERQARRALRNRTNAPTDTHKTNSLERNKKFEKQMNDKNLLMNEHYNRSQHPAASGKRCPPPPCRPVPAPWAVPRPELWPGAAYHQYGYHQYRPLPVFPNVGVGAPRPAFAPPPAVFHASAMPFNPSVPPPMLAPQPLHFHPHPRWVAPPLGMLQPPPPPPPRHNLDHLPFTQ